MGDTSTQSHELLFDVRRSVRYHDHRKQFFDRLHNLTAIVGLVFGSATMVSLLAEADSIITISMALVVTTMSAIDLVVGFSKAARLHSDLSHEFIILEKDIVLKENPNTKQLAKFTARRLDIELKEPPVLRVLDTICHNELARSMGYDKSEYKEIGWFQRMMADLIDIGAHKLG